MRALNAILITAALLQAFSSAAYLEQELGEPMSPLARQAHRDYLKRYAEERERIEHERREQGGRE